MTDYQRLVHYELSFLFSSKNFVFQPKLYMCCAILGAHLSAELSPG